MSDVTVQMKHRHIGSSPASAHETYLYSFFVQDYLLYHLLEYEKKYQQEDNFSEQSL